MTVITRSELDQMQCGEPDCAHDHDDEGLWIHGQCHVDAPLQLHYQGGNLHVSCARCKRPIVTIAVADKEPIP